MERLSGFSAVVLMLLLVGFAHGQKPGKIENIQVEQIVSRHLDSIGSAGDIKSIKSRVFIGEGALVGKLGAPFALKGTAQLASQENMVLYAILFNSDIYPYEKVAFNGKDHSFGLPSGKRTLLTDFFRAQTSILKEGLFTGTLSSAWPLLNFNSGSKVKLENAGMTKISDRSVHKVKYSSGRTGPLRVALYFDADTFHHVRTEYEYTIEPSIGRSSTDTQSTSRVERYKLTEDFSNFAKAGNLTLPLTYKITIVNDGQLGFSTGTAIREWTVKIANVYYDQKLTPEVFKVS